MTRDFKTFLLLSFLFHAAVLFSFSLHHSDDSFLWGGGRVSPQPGVLHVVVDFSRTGSGGDLLVEKGRDDLIVFGKNRRKGNEADQTVASSGLGGSLTPSGGSGEGYDETAATDGRQNLLASIRQQILREKHYPLVALREGIEGTVEVTFRMEASGALSDLAVVRSSGHSALDDEAVATVSRAQPFPYVGGDIRIALEYDLSE